MFSFLGSYILTPQITSSLKLIDDDEGILHYNSFPCIKNVLMVPKYIYFGYITIVLYCSKINLQFPLNILC